MRPMIDSSFDSVCWTNASCRNFFLYDGHQKDGIKRDFSIKLRGPPVSSRASIALVDLDRDLYDVFASLRRRNSFR